MRYIFTWPLIIAASLVLRWRGTIGQIPLFILMGFLLMTSSAHSRVAGESFADLAQKLLPSVVNISTTSVIKDPSVSPQIPQFPPGSPFEEFFRDFLERNRPQEQRRSTSLGSGFIIEKSGIVITNNHVIQDAQEIKVILQDNTTLTAKLIGRDPKTDIAVLKVNSEKDLPSVPFGNSDQLRVGDWVVAIGNPFGVGQTITLGIISATDKEISPNAYSYQRYVQTDAAINPGNSGGALVNINGELIGINVSISTKGGGSDGIGFAIPVDIAKRVIKEIIETGEVERGFIGISAEKNYKGRGVLVNAILKNGPGDSAGVKHNDVIRKIDNIQVNEIKDVQKIIGELKPGQIIMLDILRQSKIIKLEILVSKMSFDLR